MSPTPLPPPPASAPLPHAPRSAIVDRINARFREGWSGWSEGEEEGAEGEEALSAAGVLLHQFDTIDEADPSRAGGPRWLLSVEQPKWSDRISATLINSRMRPPGQTLPLYSDVQAGVIFAPRSVVRLPPSGPNRARA